MIKFTAVLKKFDKQGEKTGWTYFELLPQHAEKLKPANRREFKVRGKLDDYVIKRVSVLPMGGGVFIMPVNATMRKAIGKRSGAMIKVQLEEDNTEFVFNKDFMDCLKDEPKASAFFKTLTGSHQRYFSKWIESAKTDPTKTKRIVQAVNGLSKKQGYPEMMRALREQKEHLQ